MLEYDDAKARELFEFLATDWRSFEPDENAQLLAGEILERIGSESVVAVLLYGSRLTEKTATDTSIYDLYVVVKEYPAAVRTRSQRILSKVLPPLVFFLPPKGAVPAAKYCVISAKDFETETSWSASDLYHLGRFSKRVAFLVASDTDGFSAVVFGVMRSMLIMAELALSQMPDEFSLEEFVLEVLGLSYKADFRVERPDKVVSLYKASRKFYDTAYRLVLGVLGATEQNGKFTNPLSATQREDLDLDLTVWLLWSKPRSVARWFKNLLTFDDWLEYVLLKVERATGEKIELSPLERRFPLVFGWGKVYKFWREGKLRAGAGAKEDIK